MALETCALSVEENPSAGIGEAQVERSGRRPVTVEECGGSVEDDGTRRAAHERPQIERLAEAPSLERERDVVRPGRHRGDEAVGPGRLGRAGRPAGDLLVDGPHRHGQRRGRRPVSLAVTPLGALSIPASALAWVTESVKATRRRPVPAT